MAIKFFEKIDFFKNNDLASDEIEAAKEITESFLPDAGTEVAFSYSRGSLILKYFSEEVGYYFSPPYQLSEISDASKAFEDISEYCKLEEIPEVIVDLYEEELNLALRGARHYDVDTDDDGMNMVRIYTECMLCEELPETLSKDVYLGEFSLSYADEYEKLVKNENLNLHFGYNICDDIPNGNGEDFIRALRTDFEKGMSMTFAATVFESGENVFVGEGCLYAFDGRGGASVSFRVLPKFHRRGIGSAIFEGLMKIASKIGLDHLYGEVMKENLPSLSLVSKYAKPLSEDGDRIKFIFRTEKICADIS